MEINNKKIDISEVNEILEKITEGATSDKMPLPEVLRLCMRLGKQLQNEKLINWALAELNGFTSINDLPSYRIQETQVQGHFSGSFGSQLRFAHIPKFSVEKKDQDLLFTNYIMEPVAELENLSAGDNNEELHAFWPADVIAYYQNKPIYENMVLSSAWRISTKSSLKGVLDTVRTRVLEFVLRIEEELDLKDINNKKKNKIKSFPYEKVTQIFNNTINANAGNVSVGNLGKINQNIVNIEPGDLEGLKNYLKELGLSGKNLEDLDVALKQDEESVEQPGPATKGWLSRIMIKIGRGAISLANNTAGSLIASAILKYLGQN